MQYGAAVFLSGGDPACLTYEATCADDWTTTRGSVATNFLQLRRVGLAVGKLSEFDVAWLEGESTASDLIHLPQRYERRSVDSYWYESPTTSYAA